MSSGAINRLAARLQDILMEERALLKSGRARETVTLAEEKTAVMQDIDAAIAAEEQGALSASDRRQIETIVGMARENTRHFEAVRNGLRSIASRIEGMDGNSSVGAYDQYGTKMPFSGATGGYLRKV